MKSWRGSSSGASAVARFAAMSYISLTVSCCIVLFMRMCTGAHRACWAIRASAVLVRHDAL
eukprot:8974728-Pyramimonas_sp.AAC.1